MFVHPQLSELPFGILEVLTTIHSSSTTSIDNHYHLHHHATKVPPHVPTSITITIITTTTTDQPQCFIPLTSRPGRVCTAHLELAEDHRDRQRDKSCTLDAKLDVKGQRKSAKIGLSDTWVYMTQPLMAGVTVQVSSRRDILSPALGEIRALQARDQARTDAPEGTGSSA
ncbi:hypothetical protein Tco_0937944 [Tanacetum coccineum]|uniref:Uncharacterized protein n=1 Tax=Tanacetum coccineum TaxID=301880 RepID=A0ABQ5DMR7_9ASTR